MVDLATLPKETEPRPGPDRRHFLHQSTVLGAGVTFGTLASAQQPPELRHTGHDRIPRKVFGKTGIEVSVIGVGGHAIGQAPTREVAVRIIQEAIDAGVNFMDNAWEYHDGKSEEWMGDALQGGRRDQVFLMTKVCTHGRDKKVAMQQLDESLRRLKTDHLDLWMVHECVYWNDPELHFAKGGVIEALEEAKRSGKTRYVGFTGHKHPQIHLKMLSYQFPFDSVLMPLNCFDATFHSFEREVLPVVHQRGMAALGMKSFTGNGEPIKRGVLKPDEALRYAMSLPVATTISGVNSPEVLKQNLAIARGFKPMTPDEMDALRKRCASVAADGRLELYKTTAQFEGKPGREQHGFPPPAKVPG
jgi:aryl-alcohol dehydrogenase-like predicted oxidoreductase